MSVLPLARPVAGSTKATQMVAELPGIRRAQFLRYAKGDSAMLSPNCATFYCSQLAELLSSRLRRSEWPQLARELARIARSYRQGLWVDPVARWQPRWLFLVYRPRRKLPRMSGHAVARAPSTQPCGVLHLDASRLCRKPTSTGGAKRTSRLERSWRNRPRTQLHFCAQWKFRASLPGNLR